MNKDTSNIAEMTDLDDLFSQARAEQPSLSDTNFTKMVVNRMPNTVPRIERRGLSFDLLGLFLGLAAVSMVIEPTQLLSSALNVVPESFTLSATTLSIAVLGGLGLSLGAWWAVEKAS